MTDKEMLQLLKSRPEILTLLKKYDEVPEDRKEEAYNIIMQRLSKKGSE